MDRIAIANDHVYLMKLKNIEEDIKEVYKRHWHDVLQENRQMILEIFGGFDFRNCPCHGCTDRKIGCHSDCNNYKMYRAFVDYTKRKKIYAGIIKE